MAIIPTTRDEITAMSKSRVDYFQVDFLKALMIFLVIFDHTVPWVIKGNMWVIFWERISIPVFMVIMGFNAGLSFRRKGDVSLKELYSKDYFKRRLLRYVVPFLILYLISTIVGLIIYNFDFDSLISNQFLSQWDLHHLFIGILPFWGPGNWFIPVLFQSILILPILYKGFSKKPTPTLVLCFGVETISWLFITSLFDWNIILLFLLSIIPYLSALGLGMWFSYGHSITDKRNLFMWILFSLSTLYIIAYQFFRFRFDFVTGDYNFLFYPYSAFLFLIAMKLLPQKSENRFANIIKWIGKSTYHILLTQVFYLGLTFATWGWLTHMNIASVFGISQNGGVVGFIHLLVNWIICVSIGVLWRFMETKITKQQLKTFLTELKQPLRMNFKIFTEVLRAQPLSLLGTIIIVSFTVIGLLAPILVPPTFEDPYLIPYLGNQSGGFFPPPTLPSLEHPFGTLSGYDLYHGCIWGIRIAFYMCILTTLIAVVIGLSIGSIAGYFEGILDELLMRFTDAFFALPGLVYVLLVVTALPLEWKLLNFTITLSSIDRIILALSIIAWPPYARLIRSEIKKIKQQDFVEAAKAIGCSPLRVLTKHVLPNSIAPVLTLAFLNLGGVLLVASTVSFLGFGPGTGYAEWGSIIASSQSYLIPGAEAAAHVVLLPFIPAAFISTFILGWSLLGDSLMYVIDPTLGRRLHF